MSGVGSKATAGSKSVPKFPWLASGPARESILLTCDHLSSSAMVRESLPPRRPSSFRACPSRGARREVSPQLTPPTHNPRPTAHM